ncbi:MAG: ferritin-like domain-containing protein [Adhaeribacter sp.]
MSKLIHAQEHTGSQTPSASNPIQRRSFLKYAGAGAALSALLLAGCKDDEEEVIDFSKDMVNLGTGDVGILNYAYALEQLEAAFYTQVVAHAAFSTTFANATERTVLTDIRDHEIAHREFFRAAIPSANRIKDLTPNFDNINFADRTSVLSMAKTFEDLGVAAYNGAGKLFTNTGAGLDYLTLAGKIVSVEARHAAEIRDIISNGSFASGEAGITSGPLVNANGFDQALLPTQVLNAAKAFIKNQIVATGLPTT